MYSEIEIQKMLRLENVTIGKINVVSSEENLQELLQFANIGNPKSRDLDKPLNEINFLNFFINLDYSFTSLPKESKQLSNCMTIEKYKNIVEKIITKLKNGDKIIINDIMAELCYQNLYSSIFLEGKKS